MASSPSSKISLLSSTGETITYPVEGQSFCIAVRVGKAAASKMSLKVNSAVVPFRWDEASKLAKSQPCEFGPGQYEVTFESGDGLERATFMVVPKHFTSADYESIVRDLNDTLPKLIAVQLQKCGGLPDSNLQFDPAPTVMQDFFKLRHALLGTKERLGLFRILPTIQREPYHKLVPQYDLRNVEDLRRPVISKLHQAVTMPDNYTSIGLVKRMWDETVVSSFDTYENRLVKTYVQALQGQISRLQARLKSESAPPAIVTEVERLASEFRLACTRALFLRTLRPTAQAGARITMVLLNKPAYRQTLEDYMALSKHSSIRIDDDALNTPLQNFPYLYRLWAEVTVISLLSRTCLNAGYLCISHPWIKKDSSGLFMTKLDDGIVLLEFSHPTTGKTVKVVARRIDKVSKKASIETPVPSLSIDIHQPQKPPVSLIFTPKYNVAAAAVEKAQPKKTRSKMKALKKEDIEVAGIEPRKEDIEEMRSVVNAVKLPDGSRQIQYAAVLYPGPKTEVEAGIEVLCARPSSLAVLQKEIAAVLIHYLA